jgi:hypothetical protein
MIWHDRMAGMDCQNRRHGAPPKRLVIPAEHQLTAAEAIRAD